MNSAENIISQTFRPDQFDLMASCQNMWNWVAIVQ